ncbi:MAG TPA: lipocalin family protein [Flavobacteriaceae bacterium]|nr:lipocalin family protein [Flavobacteriaceae bacterium]
MRHFSIFFILLSLTLGLNSCSKNDDNGDTPSGILGRWNFTEMKMKGHVINEAGDWNFEVTATDATPSIYMNLKSDGTFTGQNGVMNATMVATGSINFTQTFPVSNITPTSGTWEREGNLLHLKETSGESATYEIEKLDSTTLILYADQDTANFPLDEFEDGIQSFSIRVIFNR